MSDKKGTKSDSKPAKADAARTDTDITIIDVDLEADNSRKKRKTIHGPMASFLDQSMSQAQQNSADRKMLRSV
jgi:hypothetical protein